MGTVKAGAGKWRQVQEMESRGGKCRQEGGSGGRREGELSDNGIKKDGLELREWEQKATRRGEAVEGNVEDMKDSSKGKVNSRKRGNGVKRGVIGDRRKEMESEVKKKINKKESGGTQG